MKRRILTLLLTLVMVLSLLPGTALAVNDSSSAPAVTYADLADINGTALVPDGAGENTELTVADAVRALLLWTGMTEQQLGSFPDDYLAQARSMGMIDADTDADAPCTLAAYRQMKAVADQMYDALHADKLQPLYMNGMAQPIFPYTTGEVTEGYSNDESDIIRYCVYVETNYDTDDDGKLDLVKALVQIPRAAMEGNYKAATIYEARPYITGCNESMNPGENLGSEGYDISKLYSQPDKRVPAGTATTAEAAANADSADWYYWNPYEQMYDYEDLNWYDYLCRKNLIKDIFFDIFVDLFLCYIRIVLCGQYDCIQTVCFSVIIVFYSYLRFSVRSQISQCAVFSYLCQLSGQFVCQRDGQRHIFFCLVCCETEHHTLISCSDGIDLFVRHFMFFCFQRFVDTHSDIGGLLVDGCDHTTVL